MAIRFLYPLWKRGKSYLLSSDRGEEVLKLIREAMENA